MKWTKREYNLHLKAASKVDRIKDEAFALISKRVRVKREITDYEVQQFVLERFSELDLTTELKPIVAVDENSSDPHYTPSIKGQKIIKKGSWVLIDLWAKVNVKNGIFADITWVGYVGKIIPQKYERYFQIVTTARDKTLKFLRIKVSKGEPVFGWQVDKTARDFIKEYRLGKYFIHTLGHALGCQVHAAGVNFKSLPKKDSRQVTAGLICTIEPGIYFKKFGVRSEINVFIGERGVKVTTKRQQKILQL